jgi:DNA-binding transcriptional MerR regulator
MRTYTISALAKAFGLSRSTLLYYDRIGLLPPCGRTPSGYRYYTDSEFNQLERICNFRDAGLTIDEIKTTLQSKEEPTANLLENRLHEINRDIKELKNKQRLLSGMLKSLASNDTLSIVDKEMWIDMLKAVGLNDRAMELWHAEFEKRAPEDHHDFLLSIGIPEKEVVSIRKWAGKLASGNLTRKPAKSRL